MYKENYPVIFYVLPYEMRLDNFFMYMIMQVLIDPNGELTDFNWHSKCHKYIYAI